ncbi:glycosyltransferase family 2 protein [Mycetocola spongiae]|uniref:glycosyltransferase family 2 protein n=1 Tax=Mycetocola spongiae TaxID=2859226 RepID=UPI001CF28771|nr:glycosyltransferase family 2 protein [Mycetocola spongiae]UCR90333.1 glycosyltransferase family 2 protein [Mycetocola spongiae]
MQRTPAVSVALATYNGARYIEAQLRSICSQTILPAEIILSDDGSRDDTIALAIATVSDSVPLRILRHDRKLGVRGNFSAAIEAATHPIVILADQDDYWYPTRVETAVQAFIAQPEVDLLFGDADLIDGQDGSLDTTLFETLPVTESERQQIHEGHAFGPFLRRNLATGMTVAFRRSLWTRAAPIPSDWLHDEWLAIIAAAENRIGIIEKPLMAYRIHDQNAIGVRRPTVWVKTKRVLSPRGERNVVLERRTAELVNYLEARPALFAAPVREAARGKLRVEAFRAALPRRRWARIIPVLGELPRGDYARYTSQGRVEILRDLFQPS